MKSRTPFFIGPLLGALACISCKVTAETVKPLLSEIVSLSHLVAIIRQESPKLAAEKTRVEINKADAIQAELLLNPQIMYGRYDLVGGKNTFWEGNQQQLTQINIPVLIAGQRPARREAAAKGISAAEAQVLYIYSSLLKDAWQLYIKLQAMQEKQKLMTDSEAELNKIKHIITEWQQAGAASQYDVFRISIEVANLHSQSQQMIADSLDLSGQLGATIGVPDWKPKAQGDVQPLAVSVDLSQLLDRAESNNPAINAARKLEEFAEANIKKTDRERWPVPVINLGNTWTNNPYGMASYAGVTVDVPLFDWGQGKVSKAEAEKRTATYERQALAASIRAELQRAATVLNKNKDNLDDFEKNVITQLPELETMAADAYRFGKASILELLDASRTRIELGLRRVELTEAVALSEIDTLAAAGLLDEAIRPEP